MTRQSLSIALATSIAAAPPAYASPASAGPPEGKEACYGVASKGQNDCALKGVHECASQSTVSFSPADFKYVPAGTCTSMNAEGHKGSLTPS
jgi:uncharacterized membrane protein